jgi:ATP-binding cassette subfamily B protein
MIGLVGHSGSGRSTLVNPDALLRRDRGLDPHRQRDLRRIARWPTTAIGLVLQEPFLFFGTIAENIAYGSA